MLQKSASEIAICENLQFFAKKTWLGVIVHLANVIPAWKNGSLSISVSLSLSSLCRAFTAALLHVCPYLPLPFPCLPFLFQVAAIADASGESSHAIPFLECSAYFAQVCLVTGICDTHVHGFPQEEQSVTPILLSVNTGTFISPHILRHNFGLFVFLENSSRCWHSGILGSGMLSNKQIQIAEERLHLVGRIAGQRQMVHISI